MVLTTNRSETSPAYKEREHKSALRSPCSWEIPQLRTRKISSLPRLTAKALAAISVSTRVASKVTPCYGTIEQASSCFSFFALPWLAATSRVIQKKRCGPYKHVRCELDSWSIHRGLLGRPVS